MTKWPHRLVLLVALSVILTIDPQSGDVAAAVAQLNPTGIPQQQQPQSTPQGIAEKAEEGVDKLPTTPVIPQDKSRRKRFQLFEIDGYYRFRYDWMRNFHLGFDDQGEGGAPFTQPLTCQLVEEGECSSQTLNGANMRLRLEPTINVDETTQVHAQIDLLDNVVLGSTPNSLGLGGIRRPDVPIDGTGDGQLPPEASGIDTMSDSILVRQAWAEVETSLGQVSFGRMPWHWGMGIYANAGGADPFSGGYDLDSDFGDTVDRLMFRAQIPGTELDAAIARDWTSTYPVVSNTDQYNTRTGQGQPWDLEDDDDTLQWVFMLTRFDDPKTFAEKVARGETALNYGGFLIYRTQDLAIDLDQELDDGRFTFRDLTTYTPDVWFKLGIGSITLEFEAVAVLGSIGDVSDIVLDPDAEATAQTLAVGESVEIRQLGAAARFVYRTLEDKLRLGVEVGFASGDQWDNLTPGATHVSNARPLAVGGSDTTVSNFRFDYDYDIDLILFRELLGAVTNATYFRPNLEYDVTSEITFKTRGILSFANVPVSTPGNSLMYGLELNGDLGYHKGGFFAGISYGILFPLSAMNHPVDGEGGPGFGFDGNTGDAGTAQTIQTRLMLQF